MFYKFANSVLQDISDDCMLKSFACKDDEQAELYRSVSSRIDWIINKLAVETMADDDKEEYE